MEWKEIIIEFCMDITVKGFSKITIKNYRCKLGGMADYFIEKQINPLEVKKKDVDNLVLHMLDLGHQSSTINVAVWRMKKLFDYIVEEEYLELNPFGKFKRLPKQSKEIYPLNDEEIKSIIAIARHHSYKHIAQRNVVILMLMLDGGLRVSEVCKLQESDILTNQIVIKNSKNNKDRSIAISPILRKEIIKYQRIKNKKYRDDYTDMLTNPFIVSNKGGGLKSGAIWQLMNEIQKQGNIREVVRFSGHTLRHTYASMQLRNGLDIYTLSLNMGHSSVQMTQNYVRTLKSEEFIEKSLETSTLMNLR